MKYYKLSLSVEEEETGVFPQAQYGKRQFSKVRDMKFYEFATLDPNVELVLEEGANLTSFLSTILPFSFVVDQKVKKILEGYNLPPHRYYSVKVMDKHTVHYYYWLHVIIDDFFDVVDMTRTVLKVQYVTRPQDIIDLLKFEDKESILKFRKRLRLGYKLKFHEIHFKDQILEYDFYQMQFVEHFGFINDKLKKHLEEEQVTGFRIRPLPLP